MSAKPGLLDRCPACGGKLAVQRLHCGNCRMGMEGDFVLPRLAQLSREHQDFVEVFMHCGGSITEVEKALDISYPTVRKRLDEVVAALRSLPEAAPRGHQQEILDQIEGGKLSAREGAALLRKIRDRKEKS